MIGSTDELRDLPERQPDHRPEDKDLTGEPKRGAGAEVRLKHGLTCCASSSGQPVTSLCRPLQDAPPLHVAAHPAVWPPLCGVCSVPRACWREAPPLLGVSFRLIPGNKSDLFPLRHVCL